MFHIPIFTSQLEKSREAVDESNLRAAYAECSASVLTGSAATGTGESNPVKVTNTGGVVTATKTVKLTQQKTGWESGAPSIAGVTLTDLDHSKEVVVTVKDDGSAPTFASKQ